MAYRLRKGKSVSKNVRKVAHGQVRKAMKEIDSHEMDRHEVVHQVRKRCKKLRGLIRLIRPVFGRYKKENAFLRDAARELSFVRDAQSIIESLDALAEHYGDHVERTTFDSVRWQLSVRRQEVAEKRDLVEEKLADFYRKMEKLDARIDTWQIDEDGFEAIEGGLRKTYRRGREAFAEAYRNPATETFHEWRKRVKYHWYHSRLLRDLWPDMMKVRRKTADHLSDVLGDDHDLAVLQQTLSENPIRFGGKKRLQILFGLIGQRRKELQAEAYPLGSLLYAEGDKQLGRRFQVYWQVWRDV